MNDLYLTGQHFGNSKFAINTAWLPRAILSFGIMPKYVADHDSMSTHFLTTYMQYYKV